MERSVRMGLFVLLAALFETITETIGEIIKGCVSDERQRRYEDINWHNIQSVTLDFTNTAYRTETEEEFDPVMTAFLTRQDGWAHYETQTVEYEVEDGINYYFTIRYKDGTEIYREFHETSPLTARLLKYCEKNDAKNEMTKLAVALNSVVAKKSYTSKVPNETKNTNKDRFVVMDFETTGLNRNFHKPNHDEIISIAIIDQDENVILNTYCDTVNIKSWDEAQRINGISPQDVKGYPTFAEILPKVMEILLSYDYVIAYNRMFEKTFLESYEMKYGNADHSALLKIRWGFDPMDMFMDYMNSDRYLSLETAANHFGYTYNAHNALEDVKATLYVYNKLMKSR